ncbi:hypothetical protein RFI_18510 [Reticulomyxa filosa]|uniref:Uncharacterized protein n=1 Tax=Reticulomyxa filosa TaxID=46433 RepID=X6MZ23_RETFI|nr:hypothetical protein RFI_18510 [Reticulomyxa filosa]|eukprot:ETO18744.1 hypothetical protein RFI_18510 [Reticulomyxa filosa]
MDNADSKDIDVDEPSVNTNSNNKASSSSSSSSNVKAKHDRTPSEMAIAGMDQQWEQNLGFAGLPEKNKSATQELDRRNQKLFSRTRAKDSFSIVKDGLFVCFPSLFFFFFFFFFFCPMHFEKKKLNKIQ